MQTLTVRNFPGKERSTFSYLSLKLSQFLGWQVKCNSYGCSMTAVHDVVYRMQTQMKTGGKRFKQGMDFNLFIPKNMASH